MSLNPLNELKRRLEDNATPLAKRLCLAKNVVESYHFATAPKERIIGHWLQDLETGDKLTREDLKGILTWLSTIDDLTSEFKCKLIELVSHHIKKTTLEIPDIECILSFLENNKISSQLSLQIDDYLSITISLLQLLRDKEINLSQRILTNYIKYYRESKKKLEFIIKLLNKDNLETIFGYLDTEHRSPVINVCQHILFPINKRTFFISFLQTLIRKDNLDELITEKGDNIQSVIKIMNTFFEFTVTDTEKYPKFLVNFIDVFVACFRNETQIVFAFYIMVTNVFRMEQSFIVPAMNLNPIIEDNAKAKRNLFLKMLEVLLMNEIDINVRLTDTFGEKIPKVETKKTFTTFLQTVLIGQLKLEGKIDKATLQIITTALKLDPVLIEQKIDTILPPIVAAKKNEANIHFYIEMLNCILDILFKLSRGILFMDQILPFVKTYLEAGNTEQAELEKSIKDAIHNGSDVEKINSKLINDSDLFPNETVDVYGKLSSELMFRQNKELLQMLQKNLEEHCLIMLEEGFVSPSVVTLTEVLSAILSSFFKYNKMADHVVPSQIAEEFWEAFKSFEDDSLKRFGECVLKVNHKSLTLSFLKLCVNFSHLKLLNIKYSNTKLEIGENPSKTEVLDLSVLLPCLENEQWITLLSKIEDAEIILLLDDLLLAKSMALQLIAVQNRLAYPNEHNSSTKTHLIKQLNSHPEVINNNYFCKSLFNNLDKSQCKQLSKNLVKMYLANPDLGIFDIDAITNNKILLNFLVMETAKQTAKCFENGDVFSKAINKNEFNITTFAKTNNMKELLLKFTLQSEDQELKSFVDIFNQLQIYYLDENYQLVAMFLLLAIKKVSTNKKVRRSVDQIMQSIYELSSQQPDLYQLFSVDDIFSFEEKSLMDLLTLKLKTANSSLIIRNILELAVKKVRGDSELVKRIVDILLVKNEKIANFDAFSEPKFQITCLILPFIFKQKKAITASAFRSILADLQEKLHKKLLKSFKKIDLVSSNLSIDDGSTEENMVESENNMAILNAMAAFSLTLSRYCETTDAEELKNLDCLWSGLEVFMKFAIKTIENPASKIQHIESSVHLINTTLRYIKKLVTHPLFQEKDKIFLQIWQATRSRLLLAFGSKKGNLGSSFEDFGVTLKFLCELVSVECFATKIIADLTILVVLKKPLEITIKSETTSDETNRKTFKYLFTQCLKANIVGPKCVAISKLMYRTCKNLRFWLRQHYESESSVAHYGSVNSTIEGKISTDDIKILKVEDAICILIRSDLECLSELLLAAKKVSIDYKFLDTVFELLHLIQHITTQCQVSWPSYFTIFEGNVSVLNNLLLAREEILEDRWPCYMQSYRALVASLCQKATSQTDLDRYAEEKLAEIAHNIEKLTQMITKRKKHVARIAAYTVADLCTWIELNAPSKMARIHIENCVAMLIQASDNSYAMAFLRRALAGSPGQMTMTNMYTMYKRYHKYVGNA